MRKTKEANTEYMRKYRENQKQNTQPIKTIEEQRREFIGSPEDHCIDESIYDPDCPRYRADKNEYTKEEIVNNQKWAENYLIKIGRFSK